MAPVRILIVEDELIITLDLEDWLQHLGHHVLALASSGEEAIELARALQPELVLMDIRLSGAMDGIEAAQQIRAQRWIPVVYVAAHMDAHTVARLQGMGPALYLRKPFNAPDLQATIERALTMRT